MILCHFAFSVTRGRGSRHHSWLSVISWLSVGQQPVPLIGPFGGQWLVLVIGERFFCLHKNGPQKRYSPNNPIRQ